MKFLILMSSEVFSSHTCTQKSTYVEGFGVFLCLPILFSLKREVHFFSSFLYPWREVLDMESRRKKESQKLFRHKDESRQRCFSRIMENVRLKQTVFVRAQEVLGGLWGFPVQTPAQSKSSSHGRLFRALSR